MPLLQILTDPKNFKFYAGGKGYVSTPDSFGQKSIPYGKDQYGGGWSKQPFVTKPITVNGSDVENTGGPDFLVRGGTLVPGRIADDVSRLTKLLLDKGTVTARGVEFTAKQNLLSRLSVATQTSIPFVNQGAYTPAETILQAAGVDGGLHLPLFIGAGNYYDTIQVQRNLDAVNVNNRLYSLYETKIENKPISYPGLKGFESTNPEVLMKYGGGPDAPYGVGKTNIFFADQRTGLNNPLIPKSGSFEQNYRLQSSGSAGLNISAGILNREGRYALPTNGSGVNILPDAAFQLRSSDITSFTQQQIEAATPFQQNASNPLRDFRQTLVNDPITGTDAKQLLISTDYQNYNLVRTFGVADAGNNTRRRNAYYNTSAASAGSRIYADKINLLGVQTGETYTPLDDLIPFYITVLGYNEPIDPLNPNSNFIKAGENRTVQFRAYIDSFTDGYSAALSDFRFMGRGENFYTYNGYTRTVNMSFTIYAHTYPEIKNQYRRLNYLVSSLTPSYSEIGIMRGNFAKITVGDYIMDTPGVISGINVEIPTESPWETGRNENGTLANKSDRLPYMVRVTGLTFLPIQNFIPRLGADYISD
jgi:hypothetical protein